MRSTHRSYAVAVLPTEGRPICLHGYQRENPGKCWHKMRRPACSCCLESAGTLQQCGIRGTILVERLLVSLHDLTSPSRCHAGTTDVCAGVCQEKQALLPSHERRTSSGSSRVLLVEFSVRTCAATWSNRRQLRHKSQTFLFSEWSS